MVKINFSSYDNLSEAELKLRFKKLNSGNEDYKIGDKIGQIIILPYPEIEFNETTDLENSERGSGGFGSTG